MHEASTTLSYLILYKTGQEITVAFHHVFSKILMRQASYNNPKNPKLVSK